MTLSISILLALVVFLLLISKILPPTSIVIPLIAKYLLFTFIMNIITIFCTVVIINYNYRTPRTHKMPYWIRRLCIDILPRILRMERPKKYEREDNIHVTEADRAKQTMMNYIQASRALSIASPMMMHNNSTTTSNMNSNHHHDEELELKKRHTVKKRHHHHHHRHNKRHQQSSSTDDEDQDNHLTSQEVDLLLTKEAYEAAEDLSFIANHMRSACHYEEVGVYEGWARDKERQIPIGLLFLLDSWWLEIHCLCHRSTSIVHLLCCHCCRNAKDSLQRSTYSQCHRSICYLEKLGSDIWHHQLNGPSPNERTDLCFSITIRKYQL